MVCNFVQLLANTRQKCASICYLATVMLREQYSAMICFTDERQLTPRYYRDKQRPRRAAEPPSTTWLLAGIMVYSRRV
jgi:hypothetical protein